MRSEKKYLIEEVTRHLKKSDYFLITNYQKVTVSDVAALRAKLAPEQAEFHVVKNSSLRVAAKDAGLPGFDSMLAGQTAIVVGGRNASGVAKIVKKFFDDTQKLEIKGGVVSGRVFNTAEVTKLSELPSLEVLRAQLLGLLNQPATSLVRVINGVPQALVNVLQAKVRAAA
ncbi:MAG TPA: 50S ribosomal protein L10 [Opitutaceae bacterium]|nr:50S ribosomal protein L10 [Opitutaceae bacterium]